MLSILFVLKRLLYTSNAKREKPNEYIFFPLSFLDRNTSTTDYQISALQSQRSGMGVFLAARR